MTTLLSEFWQQMLTTGYFGSIQVGTFLLNVLIIWILVHLFYFRKCRRRDFYFTFMIIGVVIYFLVYFMIYVLDDMKGKTGIGIGIGLFGIFSIMRYRTDTMPVREMTYLFSIICIAVVNALGSSITTLELVIPNVLVVIAVALCEYFVLRPADRIKLIQYDRIALITPDKRDELIEDLEKRLGLKISLVEVGSVDFLRDTALLKVHYKDKNAPNELDKTIKVKREQWEEGQ